MAEASQYDRNQDVAPVLASLPSGFRTTPALTAQQWQSFWWLPAGFAVAVLVVFTLLFRDQSADERKTVPGSS